MQMMMWSPRDEMRVGVTWKGIFAFKARFLFLKIMIVMKLIMMTETLRESFDVMRGKSSEWFTWHVPHAG